MRFGVGRRFAGRIDRRGHGAGQLAACARHTPQILPTRPRLLKQTDDPSIHNSTKPIPPTQETPPAAATKNHHPWRPCSAQPLPPRAVSPSRLRRRRRRQALAAAGPDGAWWRCVRRQTPLLLGAGSTRPSGRRRPRWSTPSWPGSFPSRSPRTAGTVPHRAIYF